MMLAFVQSLKIRIICRLYSKGRKEEILFDLFQQIPSWCYRKKICILKSVAYMLRNFCETKFAFSADEPIELEYFCGRN